MLRFYALGLEQEKGSLTAWIARAFPSDERAVVADVSESIGLPRVAAEGLTRSGCLNFEIAVEGYGGNPVAIARACAVDEVETVWHVKR